MRKALPALLLPVVLALDWAALDDITTGNEPSLWLEWSFLAASVPLLYLLVGRAWQPRR